MRRFQALLILFAMGATLTPTYSAGPPGLPVILRVQVEFHSEQENGTRSHVAITSLVRGETTEYGEDFPKLQLTTLSDSGKDWAAELRLVSEDGRILDSTIVYIQPKLDTEFSLKAEEASAEGKISHR